MLGKTAEFESADDIRHAYTDGLLSYAEARQLLGIETEKKTTDAGGLQVWALQANKDNISHELRREGKTLLAIKEDGQIITGQDFFEVVKKDANGIPFDRA